MVRLYLPPADLPTSEISRGNTVEKPTPEELAMRREADEAFSADVQASIDEANRLRHNAIERGRVTRAFEELTLKQKLAALQAVGVDINLHLEGKDA